MSGQSAHAILAVVLPVSKQNKPSQHPYLCPGSLFVAVIHRVQYSLQDRWRRVTVKNDVSHRSVIANVVGIVLKLLNRQLLDGLLTD